MGLTTLLTALLRGSTHRANTHKHFIMGKSSICRQVSVATRLELSSGRLSATNMELIPMELIMEHPSYRWRGLKCTIMRLWGCHQRPRLEEIDSLLVASSSPGPSWWTWSLGPWIVSDLVRMEPSLDRITSCSDRVELAITGPRDIIQRGQS